MAGRKNFPRPRFRPTLEILKDREKRFHDNWAASIDPASVLVEESWNAVTCPEHRWIRQRLGDLRGLRVLDVGCGAGEAAVWFAKQGAEVVANDLSEEFLNLVGRVAARHGVSVGIHLGDGEHLLGLDDNTFDIVYAGNFLHHVNLEKALQTFWRVLKPGGRLFTWDPLRHNPIINVYRRMAKQVRTEDERPLAIHDVATFRRYFHHVEQEYFWFCTLALFLRFYFIERVHPSRERYWKKIICEHERLASLYQRLQRWDRHVLCFFPWLKRYCWNMVVCAEK